MPFNEVSNRRGRVVIGPEDHVNGESIVFRAAPEEQREVWADFAEIRSWRETSTAADFGEIGPHFWHHSLFLSDTGPLTEELAGNRMRSATLKRMRPIFLAVTNCMSSGRRVDR